MAKRLRQISFEPAIPSQVMHAASEPEKPEEFLVEAEFAGTRLDWFLARRLPDRSRVALRRAINAAAVTVDGRRVKASYTLRQGQRVRIAVPALPHAGPEPEAIPLAILYEDPWLVAIDKPAGMVVHPAKGHWSGTLTAALAHHFQSLSGVGGPTRPGIVHRLDRDTSGVIVVARTDEAHLRIAAQFEARTVEKEYFAIVAGNPDRDQDFIDAPIGAHPYQREKMAIRRDHATSRQARSFYQVRERFDGYAALRILPYTGRTHQIRVHLAHIGTPVLCDRQYGGRGRLLRGEIRRDPHDTTLLLGRHALHARRLKLVHPASGAILEITAPLPADLEGVLAELRHFRAR